jgi:hypothetical protein
MNAAVRLSTICTNSKEFSPFRLDTVNECLWRHRDTGPDERILLPPKPFAVLRYLVEHPGRLYPRHRCAIASRSRVPPLGFMWGSWGVCENRRTTLRKQDRDGLIVRLLSDSRHLIIRMPVLISLTRHPPETNSPR